METFEKGEISEISVAAELKKMGYEVLRPWGDNQRYDLVLDSDGEFIRVQVKRGRIKNGAVKFNTYSSKNSIKEKRQYTQDEIDGFIIHEPERDSFYWVPVEEAPKNVMHLRVDEPDANMSTINWAEEYRINETFK